MHLPHGQPLSRGPSTVPEGDDGYREVNAKRSYYCGAIFRQKRICFRYTGFLSDKTRGASLQPPKLREFSPQPAIQAVFTAGANEKKRY